MENRPYRRLLRPLLAGVLTAGLVASGLSLGATTAMADPATGITLGTLEVENRTEPLGVDVAKPAFSWVTSSSARDVSQTSYRLRVATSAESLGSDPIWDSGVVASAESFAVEYGGPALDPATTYVWRVDAETTAGSSSAESTFSTGLFNEADWAGSEWIGNARGTDAGLSDLTFAGASWIWTPESGGNPPGEDRAFRKTLTSPSGKKARSAEVIITADDSFKLWVNGKLIGQTEGATNEWQSSKFFKVDLKDASNVFAVRTTNGPGSPAGLLSVIRVTYDDASTEIVKTEAGWKGAKTIPSGFEAVGFDDSAWPATAVQALYGQGAWGNGVRLPTAPPAPAPLLRTEFSADKDVRSAKVYVAAGGYANVSLNGAPINDEILSPGFTDYDDHAQYTVTDLTDQVRQGSNALGIELGRGFYGMKNGNVWNWDSAPFHDEPVARAVLRLEYTDGTVSDVVTDNTWTIHDGPTQVDDLYGGETYDASRAIPNFDTVGFDDSAWKQASSVAGPKGELMNQSQQPIRVTEELPASEITSPAAGTYVVKFPRMIAGTVEFTATGAEGDTIRASYGEKLRANGRVNMDNNGGFQSGFQTDRFILAGTGEPETWAGKFSYKGFQYIEVTGWPGGQAPPLSAFTAHVIHTDAEETGSFDSSDATMNSTHRAVVDTLKNNIHGIVTDTPMFEKNGWTGDGSVGAEMFFMNLDVQNLFTKWMGDIGDSLDENGAPLVIAPSSDQWGQWGKNPSWHSAYVLIPYWLYQYGGDKRPLAQYYDGMKTYVDLEFDRSPGGIADARLGDWVAPEASPAGGNPPEDTKVSATAYLYTMLVSMEKSARLLGNTADADDFAAKAVVVKDAFNERFYDAGKGIYRGSGDNGYRQTHNVLALAFGLAPSDEVATTVAANLAGDVKSRGNKLNTGILGTKHLLPVLTKYGYSDVAYAVATQTAYPSWGYMIENGATSMWEHWSTDARSLGHYFLGTVDDWFYHDVAGIRTSETTGYRDISIAPAVTKELDWAKAETVTPFGPVSVDWKNTATGLSLATHVPVGSVATVKLPAANAWAVTEGGVALADVDGVRSVAVEAGNVLVTIGSGDYSFAVNTKTGAVGDILDRLADLQTAVDAAHMNGDLSDADHTALTASIASGTNTATDGLLRVADGKAVDGAATLTGVLTVIGEIDAQLAKLSADPAVNQPLVAAALAVRTSADATISELLQLTASAVPDAAAYKPGENGAIAATVSNGGETTVSAVTASVEGLDESWVLDPAGDVPVTEELSGASDASATLGFTVPQGSVPGSVAPIVRVKYTFKDVVVGLPAATELTIDSPIQITSAVVAPETVEPGAGATLTVAVLNSGSEPARGHIETAVPAGWVTPLAGADQMIAAGATAEFTVPVFVSLGTDSSPATHSLTASFVRDGVTFASAPAAVKVAVVPITAPAAGYDHVDLGNAADEQAHGLTASASSGTNTEAGLTRRYAGHLTDFSFFEFNAAVVPNAPFVIRSIETYDRAQTKKYKMYVNGVEVHERLFTHTGGLGTETFEFVVGAEHATATPVRIKFENLDDHGFYDPSIADVWTAPVAADAVAPQAEVTATPAGPTRTGWYTKAPVTLEVAAQDDRQGDLTVRAGLAGALDPYTAPIAVTAEGESVLSYNATDVAGNTSETKTHTVKLDTVAPATTASVASVRDPETPIVGDPIEHGVIEHGAALTFAATDATSGVASTAYRVNDGEWTAGTSVEIRRAGEFSVEFRSTDTAGNVGAVERVTGTVVIPDETAPAVTATVSKPGLGGWYVAGAELTLEASDAESDIASIEYTLNGDEWRTYIAPVVLPEGNNAITYRATDAAQNVSAPGSLRARVDATAPSAWGWLSNDGRVTALGNDGVTGSGISHNQYSLDGEAWVDNLSALIGSAATPSTVHMRAIDVAGNVGDTVVLARSSQPGPVQVVPGAQTLVEASGFAPGATVTIELHSTPITLATVNADARGVVSVVVTIPADLEAGDHSLVFVVAADPGTPGTPGTPGGGTVTIPAQVLSDTGAQTAPLLLAAFALLAAGLVFATRRRWGAMLKRAE